MTDYEKAIRAAGLAADLLARTMAESLADPDIPAVRAKRYDVFVRISKEIDSQLRAMEEIVKSERIECDVRIRATKLQHRVGSMTPGTSGAMWLTIAVEGRMVLEILKHEDEWATDTEARFRRALSASPEEHLAQLLAAKRGSR